MRQKSYTAILSLSIIFFVGITALTGVATGFHWTGSPPEFKSGSNPTFNEEATGTVIDVNATDGDGGANDSSITYSLTSGADESAFSIDTSNGELTFDSAPDYENPTDSDGNNDYVVDVTADDGSDTETQIITVDVTDVDEQPVFKSGSSPAINEQTTGVVIDVNATDGDGGTNDSSITYSLTSGADESVFSIDSSNGELNFDSAPDYENPTDADSNNDYVVDVEADDGSDTTTQTITVDVTDVDEQPVFNSASNPAVNEQTTGVVIDVNATDGDGGANDSSITYSLTGGVDESAFSIDSSNGELNFDSASDYENPTDADSNNDYVVDVEADDGSDTTTQTITVDVTDVDEQPVFNSASNPAVNEQTTGVVIDVNATDGDGGANDSSITYSLTGGVDESAFSIDSSNGELNFDSAPDYENPTDADGNNDYIVDVEADDGAKTKTQTITVDVTDQAPSISSYTVSNPSGQDVSVSFNSTDPLTTIEATVSSAESGSLSTGDFTENIIDGTYEYSATYQGSSDGTYKITLDRAKDSGGNDGASSQSDSVDVSTSSGGGGGGGGGGGSGGDGNDGDDEDNEENSENTENSGNEDTDSTDTLPVKDIDPATDSEVTDTTVEVMSGESEIEISKETDLPDDQSESDTDGSDQTSGRATDSTTESQSSTVTDTSIEVQNPDPGETLMIDADNEVTVAKDFSVSSAPTSPNGERGASETPDGEDAQSNQQSDPSSGENTEQDVGGGTDTGSDDSSGNDPSDTGDSNSGSGGDSTADNIQTEEIGVQVDTTESFELSVTTYENDLTQSGAVGSDADTGNGAANPAASGAALIGMPPAQTSQDSTLAPDEVKRAAEKFEGKTGTVAAGYLDVNTTLTPSEIAGAMVTFSIREAYIEDLGVEPEAVQLHHQTGGGWNVRNTTYLGSDGTYHQFEGVMPSFSVFAMGTGAELFDSADSNLTITDTGLLDQSISPGETVTVTAEIENRGQTITNETVRLLVNGSMADSDQVEIASDGTRNVSLQFTPTEPGKYGLEIKDSTEMVTVKEGGFPLVPVLAIISLLLAWRRYIY